MKNYSYKNRGMFLENILNDSNTFYLNQNKCVIYKKPTPVKVLNVSYPSRKSTVINKAVFESISTLDYCGVYKGKYIEFDAKETKCCTSFPLSNIQDHQIKHITNIIKHKGIIFLIISINNEFYIFDGKLLLNYINNNDRKSIPYNYIKENCYKITEKYMPRLDYLEGIDKLYFKGENNNEKIEIKEN